MFGNNVLGIIFAYAHEERVRDLTELRVMASVPFGGRYRLVDFTLSNMVNSGPSTPARRSRPTANCWRP